MEKYYGIIGPIIFLTVAFVLPFWIPEYNSSTQMISELGATNYPYSTLFNYLAFMPNGIFIFLFGLYFFKILKQASFTTIPAVLICIHGAGMFLATWFSCDISCTPPDPSFKQIIHNVLAAIKFPALHISILILAIQLLKHKKDMAFAYGFIITFLVSGVFMGLFIASVQTRELTGIYQRLFICTLYLWLIFTALRSKRLIHEYT